MNKTPPFHLPTVLALQRSASEEAQKCCKECCCCCCRKPDSSHAALAAFTVPKIFTIIENLGLSVTKGVVGFDEAAVVAAGVSEPDAEYVGNLVSKLNELVERGSLQIGEGTKGWNKITPKTPQYFAATLVNTTIAGTQYQVDVDVHWYGTKITLNKAATTKLAQIVALGGTATSVAAAAAAAGIITAPADLPLGLIAGLLFLGAAVINVADLCKGVSFIVPWVVPPPIIMIPNF
jgi:hypothetical protein